MANAKKTPSKDVETAKKTSSAKKTAPKKAVKDVEEVVKEENVERELEFESTIQDDNFSKFKSMKIGNFTLKHLLIGIVCVVLAILLIRGVANSFSKESKVPDYGVVYTNDDGDLMVVGANGKKPVKLANDSSNDVQYANTTERFILFTKDDNLYLYDKKKGEDTTKIDKDVSSFGFSDDDKYIYYVNDEDELYTYKKESKKIDSDVTYVVGTIDNNIVYSKDDELYFRNMNGKKDKVKVASDVKNQALSEDCSKILYQTDDDDLYIYKVSSKKATKIASDVSEVLDVTEDLDKIIYSDNDDDVYYVKGTKATKIVSEVNILDVDANEQQFVYEKDDELFYQKGTKKAVKIDDAEDVKSAYIFNGNEVYYTVRNDDKYELNYSKVGSKASSPKTVMDDVYSYVYTYYDKGLIAFSNVESYVGELNIIKGGKATKVADDVKTTSINPNHKGNKLYFLGDYDSKDNSGALMSTTGKKAKTLVEDVKDYDYVKDNIIYVSTGYSTKSGKFDLNVYNGRKLIKIADSVRSVNAPYVNTKK